MKADPEVSRAVQARPSVNIGMEDIRMLDLAGLRGLAHRKIAASCQQGDGQCGQQACENSHLCPLAQVHGCLSADGLQAFCLPSASLRSERVLLR